MPGAPNIVTITKVIAFIGTNISIAPKIKFKP